MTKEPVLTGYDAYIATLKDGNEVSFREMIAFRGQVLPTEPNDYCSIARDNPKLIEIIETWGAGATTVVNGGREQFYPAKVIEIPMNVEWEVCNDDMHVEWIREKHRRWS